MFMGIVGLLVYPLGYGALPRALSKTSGQEPDKSVPANLWQGRFADKFG